MRPFDTSRELEQRRCRRILASALTILAAIASPAALAQMKTDLPPGVPGARPVTVEHVKVHSAAIAGNLEGESADRDVFVFLPPGYHQDSGRRYPVVYALHGFFIGAEEWAHEIHVPQTIEGAFAKGSRPMIVVLPDSKTIYGGSMYSSSVTSGDFERFIAHDLVAYIDAHYRTLADRRSRGLVGHSMGGYGAARIGMRHPEVFGSLYIMSPCCLSLSSVKPMDAATEHAVRALKSPADSAALPWYTHPQLAQAAAWSPDPKMPPLYFDLPFDNGVARPEILEKWSANEPLSFVDQYIDSLREYRAIAIDVGDQDDLRFDAGKLHAVFDSYGITNSFTIYHGTHTSAVAYRFQDHVLPFFSRTLCFERCSAAAQAPSRPAQIAVRPPMGWNSYDAYGTTITEAQFRANIRWMSQHLARYGWRYAVIDAEWFVRNPTANGNSPTAVRVLDQYGRYIPAPNRFPSAEGGAGFKPLADYVHSLGLKFGIHILRGIPREAVARNLPIEGTPYTAAQAADVHSSCVWNPDNYGVDPHRPAGQAYYDSIARLYASWGVDFIKADCIANHPYAAGDIRMLSAALRATGRDMVLSLSPGPAPIEKLTQLRGYANMWRISNDVWDLWHSSYPYPQGVGDQFARAARWAPLAVPGGWPDGDMLALGSLSPAPGWGKPRHSQLTHAEQRTYMTLWCVSRSPLMLGANLTAMDPWTLSLLDNPEVIAVDQLSAGAHQVLSADGTVVWVSRPEGKQAGRDWYVAVFNLQANARAVTLPWRPLSLPGRRYAIRDLWSRRDLGPAVMLRAQLPAHGAALYLLSQQ